MQTPETAACFRFLRFGWLPAISCDCQIQFEKGDRLLQVGRKRSSFNSYAQREVHFLEPRDEKEWEDYLAASGRK